MNWVDHDFDEDDGAPHGEVTCNRCGERGLEWIDLGSSRWRLYPIDGRKAHVCKPDAGDFAPIAGAKTHGR